MTTIVQVIPRLYPGGAERLVLQYAQEFSKKDFSVYVMSSVDDGALRPLFEQTKARLIVGSRKVHGGRWGVWKFLKRELLRIKPDIIHTHLMGGDIIGYAWKRIYPQTIWISTVHNVEYHTSFMKRMIWKICLKKVDAVVAVSDSVAVYSRDHFNIPEEKIRIIYNGVETKKWRRVTTKKIDATHISLATIGRLEEQKGHVYALRALAELKHLPWEYHVYGEGSLQSELEYTARALGIAHRIVWHGYESDMAMALKDIDIVLQPSLWEGMSLVVLESMAAGRVVIASTAAGAGIIENARTGYLFETGNVQELKRLLGQVLENPEKISNVGKTAQKYVQQQGDIHDHYRAIAQIYASFVSSH